MSSISSSSLSMSSLIFLPFLASSGLAAAPSPPPSDGFVGRVSFFFCSAMRPSIGARDGVHDRPVTSPLTILTEPSIPQYLCHPTAYRLKCLLKLNVWCWYEERSPTPYTRAGRLRSRSNHTLNDVWPS